MPKFSQFIKVLAIGLLSATSLCLLQACSTPSPIPSPPVLETSLSNGTGGTGKQAEQQIVSNGVGGTGKNGTGGTGLRDAELAKNGTGGTGKQGFDNGTGGTGIVGTVTGFGSIWINGAHVEYDKDTRISENQKDKDSKAYKTNTFKIGQVLAIKAQGHDIDYLADQVDIVHEVIGPIESYDAAQQHVTVLGQTVLLPETAIVARKGKDVYRGKLKPGLWIAVSGLRKPDQTIVASRIDLIKPQANAQVIGKARVNSTGKYQIGELEFNSEQLAEEKNQQTVYTGPVSIQKDAQGNSSYVFSSNSTKSSSSRKVLKQSSEVIVEAFIDPFAEQNQVAGYKFTVPNSQQLAATELNELKPIRMKAVAGEKGFLVREMHVVPMGAEQYENIMPDIIQGDRETIDLDAELDTELDAMNKRQDETQQQGTLGQRLKAFFSPAEETDLKEIDELDDSHDSESYEGWEMGAEPFFEFTDEFIEVEGDLE